jgi:hypothetical protein
MKKIILERNVNYALWENLMYSIVFLSAFFVGATFFSTGSLAQKFSILFGILLLICLFFILSKKGLVITKKIYRGYFIFGFLYWKKEVKNPLSTTFTLLIKKHRQKYIRSYKEPNWEYSLESFELYFFDNDGAIRDKIITCSNKSSAERAIDFLTKYKLLEFKSLY